MPPVFHSRIRLCRSGMSHYAVPAPAGKSGADLVGRGVQHIAKECREIRTVGKAHMEAFFAGPHHAADLPCVESVFQVQFVLAGKVEEDIALAALHHIQEFEEIEVNGEGTNSDWGSIYKNLKNVLDGKEELFVKPEQVLLCMRVIEAAFISAKENRVVYID